MDWSAVAARVVVEACVADPRDVVLVLGASDGEVVRGLAPRVNRVVVVDPDRAALDRLRPGLPANVELRVGSLLDPPALEGLTVVAMHWTFRKLPPRDQQALVERLGRLVPGRGLLVIGDVLWSMPPEVVDEPEQYGDALAHAPTTRQIEAWVRKAGFLPDIHRFGPAVAVVIGLRDAR